MPAAAPSDGRMGCASLAPESEKRHSDEREFASLEHLRAEVERLEREKGDLEIALLTSNEHGDLLEEHLYHVTTSLAAEVRERQAVEERLQKLIDAITQEKIDLEIMVQILIDQGDASAEEGEKARIDGLTGIANRRRLDEYLSHEWGRHRRAQQPIALLVCDVDHFKLYNDHYGHQAGDDCLKLVANVIAQTVRRSSDLVARYGGEEFAIVLPNTDLNGAKVMADAVRSALRKAAIPHAYSSICDIVSVSIGVSCKIPPTLGCPDAEPLVEEADRFLYLAKHRGRDCVACQD